MKYELRFDENGTFYANSESWARGAITAQACDYFKKHPDIDISKDEIVITAPFSKEYEHLLYDDDDKEDDYRIRESIRWGMELAENCLRRGY